MADVTYGSKDLPKSLTCSEHTCASRQQCNVALEKGSSELNRSRRQLSATATDHAKVDAHSGLINWLITTFRLRHAGTPNEGMMAIPSSASTSAICASSRLTMDPICTFTPACASCLSMSCWCGWPGESEISVSPPSGEAHVELAGLDHLDQGRQVGIE